MREGAGGAARPDREGVIGDRVAGALLVVLGAAAGLEASTFDVSFLTDPVGPKALPYLTAAILVVAGVHVLWRPGVGRAWPEREVMLRMAAAAAAFIVYAAMLPWLGFVVSTTLVVAVLAELYRAPRPHGVVSAALLAGALWLLFVHLLALPLPVGELWIP